MIGEISAAFASLKAASDIAKGLNAANTQAQINEVKIELQSLILQAQQALTSAQENEAAMKRHIQKLETDIEQLNRWEEEKKRYALKDFGGETFAYALKGDATHGEPSHNICPACYEKGHKSILQNAGGNFSGRQKMGCPACGTDYMLGQYQKAPPSRVTGAW